MATTVDTKIKESIAAHGKVKTLVTVLFAMLSFGKARGWFQKKDGIKE